MASLLCGAPPPAEKDVRIEISSYKHRTLVDAFYSVTIETLVVDLKQRIAKDFDCKQDQIYISAGAGAPEWKDNARVEDCLDDLQHILCRILSASSPPTPLPTQTIAADVGSPLDPIALHM
jgi:hypothetical protein